MQLRGYSLVRITFCFMVGAALAGATISRSAPGYEIFAISYGRVKNYPVGALVSGADVSRKMDAALMFWLVRGEGRTILFDAGFHHDRFLKQWHPEDYLKPTDALGKMGIRPEDITDIVVSHMHPDHVDGIELFPNAHIWMQKDELQYYAGEAWQLKQTQHVVSADNVLLLVELNTRGRVSLIDGDAREIFPGITCYVGGKHTYQSQFMAVKAAVGTVVLASDNVYLYENLEKHLPITMTMDANSNLRTQERMKEMVADPKFIIPGHDPLVFTKFPNPFPGVAKIGEITER